MSKKRLSRNAVQEIGTQRIEHLISLSTDCLGENDKTHARRYLQIAKNIGMKTKTKIPKEFVYCKECMIPLVPGKNGRTRLTGGKIVTTCGECGAIKRMPYIRERVK